MCMSSIIIFILLFPNLQNLVKITEKITWARIALYVIKKLISCKDKFQ